MRKVLALIVALAIGAVAAGCSSGASDGSKATSTTKPKTTTTAPVDVTTTAKGGGTSDTIDPAVADFTLDDYQTAMITNLSSGSIEDGQLVISKREAGCVGPKWAETMTLRKFQQAGVTPKDVASPKFNGTTLGLDTEQAKAMVAAFASCDVDVYALFATSVSMGLPAKDQACAVAKIDHDLTDALLIKTFSGQDANDEFLAVTNALSKDCNIK